MRKIDLYRGEKQFTEQNEKLNNYTLTKCRISKCNP